MQRLTSILAFALASTASLAAAQDAPPEVVKALCASRPMCVVLSAKSAGKDTKQRPMRVIDLGLAGPDADYEGAHNPDCFEHELWLVVGATKVERRQLIVSMCNDGYGARGVGEDVITVSDNTVVVNRSGGSAWGWGTSWTIKLDPTFVLSRTTDGYYTLNENNFESREFSPVSFGGKASWSAPMCKDRSKVGNYEFGLIPMVSAPGFDWRFARLGRCALHVDSSMPRGFRGMGTIHGSTAAKTDSTMRVVATGPADFVVEITDDVWSKTAKSWVKRDHIELWTGSSTGYMNECVDRGDPKQWGIMLDGTVHAAHGKPAPESAPKVDVLLEGQTARFHVVLPEPLHTLTFVYSDSDDGKTQERLIATSNLTFGDVRSLGELWQVDSKNTQCRVEGGKLQPSSVVRKPTDAMVDW